MTKTESTPRFPYPPDVPSPGPNVDELSTAIVNHELPSAVAAGAGVWTSALLDLATGIMVPAAAGTDSILRSFESHWERGAPPYKVDRHVAAIAGSVHRSVPARDLDVSSNLLAVVAELDAAVLASEAGDNAVAIGHITAARESILEDATPVRVSVAAQLLGLSRRTVDTWVEAGLLSLAEEPGTSVKVLDPRRLYAVKRLVDDLRKAGRKRGLAEAVWQRLQDQEELASPRLQESLKQVRAGEGVSLAEYFAQSAHDEDAGGDAS